MSQSKMTTTSYAILGLLAIKPWTTYELAQQVHVRMRRFWPRAASKLYEEPKKLVAQGFATSEVGRVGKRKRTTYSVTPAGKDQLTQWLADSGGAPVLEFEALLKVFFAEYGTKADLLATLAVVQDWAAEQLAEDSETARRYLESAGQFPDRTAHLVLVGRFLSDFAEMTGRWAQWAAEEARQWPDEVREATPDWGALREIADRKAEW
jgi:PadR family transcriptional regulator AphA